MTRRALALLGAAFMTAGTAVAISTAPVGAAPVGAAPTAPLPPGGSYTVLTPKRVLDTRFGTGATHSVTVATGAAGVPSSGVAAVAVNLTVTAPSSGGYLTAYQAGASQPATSNVNYVKGQTIAGMAIVAVDASGHFTLYSSASAQLIADVEGYFSTPQAAAGGGLFTPVAPARLLDTRISTPSLGPNSTRTLPVTGRGGVPSGASAVVLNTTITGASTGGYVTTYPAGQPRPGTSTINFTRAQTLANRAIVPVGSGGAINLYNNAGTTHVIIDVTGYFTTTGGGSFYVPVVPRRIVDTRFFETTSYHPPTITQQVAGNPCALSQSGADCNYALMPAMSAVTRPVAAILTVTVVGQRSAGYDVVYNGARPATSDLDYPASSAVANLSIVGTGADGKASVYQSTAGRVLEDISGYFAEPPVTPTPQGLWAWHTGRGSNPIAARRFTLAHLTQLVGGAGSYNYGLTSDGATWQWDANGIDGTVTGLRRIANIPSNVVSLADGQRRDISGMVVALTATHAVLEWGFFPVAGGLWFGQRAITGLPAVASIGAAPGVGYAVGSDGTVWAWGDNASGQFGNGVTSPTETDVPVQVTALPNVASIGGVRGVSFAVDPSGGLWRWGSGAGSLVPAKVTTVCSGSAGRILAGAWVGPNILCPDGTVWVLPRSGTAVTQVPGLTGIASIARGTSGLQALDTSGRVFDRDPITGVYAPVYALTGMTALGANSFESMAAAG